MARLSKHNKTYRQDPHIVKLIEAAAAGTELSEAEIVDACVLAQVANVVAKVQRRREALVHPETVRALQQSVRKLLRSRSA